MEKVQRPSRKGVVLKRGRGGGDLEEVKVNGFLGKFALNAKLLSIHTMLRVYASPVTAEGFM
jgi:hypothetical protein